MMDDVELSRAGGSAGSARGEAVRRSASEDDAEDPAVEQAGDPEFVAPFFGRVFAGRKDDQFRALGADEDAEAIENERSRRGRRSSRSACRLCRVAECVVFSGMLMVIVTLALVIRQNVCWSAEDELNLLASLKGKAFLLEDAPPVPLARAHSHNDYQQAVPLSLALSAGFCSIEADVFESNGDLTTGHIVGSANRLEDQYLNPLAQLSYQDGRGPIQPLARGLGVCLQTILLVDLKSSADAAWQALEGLIAQVNRRTGYRVFECYDENGHALPEPAASSGRSPVRVVMSGISASEAPGLAAQLKQRETRCTKIDGRWSNGNKLPGDAVLLSFLGMISAPWEDAFLGKQLASMVEQSHGRGIPLRFWGTNDSVAMWQELLNHDVDLISTDRIAGLSAFLMGRSALP